MIHRDIKPDNFLFNKSKQKIFIIDFGFCIPYLNKSDIIDPPPVKNFIGSLDYASINCHNLKTQSRRDDLESICYVIYYLLRGSLPWSGCTPEKILSMKQLFPDFCDCKEVISLWQKITNLGFNENPNYMLYTEILSN